MTEFWSARSASSESLLNLVNDDVLAYWRTFNPRQIARDLVSFVPLIDMIAREGVNFANAASFGAGSYLDETTLALMAPNLPVHRFDQTARLDRGSRPGKFKSPKNLTFNTFDFSEPMKQKFDLVLSVHTLAYIYEMEAALTQLVDATEAGGFLYIQTDLYHEDDSREPDLKRKKARAWEKHQHHHLGFSRLRMIERLRRRGCDVIAAGYSSYKKFDHAAFLFLNATSAASKKPVTDAVAREIVRLYEAQLLGAEAVHRPQYRRLDTLPLGRRPCTVMRLLARKGKMRSSPSRCSSATVQPRSDALLPVSTDLRAMMSFDRKDLAPTDITFDSNSMNIHWVVPDFVAGMGGHMTIFRIAHHLEVLGHKVTFWLMNLKHHREIGTVYEDVVKFFQPLRGEVRLISDGFEQAQGDAIIATNWNSVLPCLSVTNFIRRFYFVQDFEPSFYPVGARTLAAEQTYREDVDCICAGPWLSDMMRQRYNRWATHFWLAADPEVYKPNDDKAPNKPLRIAFYARASTERRAVDLGMLGLELLAKRNVNFEVDFFGSQNAIVEAPFPFVDHRVTSPEKAGEIFAQADVGMVFSATNYSLVVQEMMACGLPVIELSGDNTTSVIPENTATLVEPRPDAIASGLELLLGDEKRRRVQADKALKWVRQLSWFDAARAVEAGLIERLRRYGEDTANDPPAARSTGYKASVVIPTWNAGSILDRVLAMVIGQLAPWPFEVLIIDSGSTDKTLDIVKKYPTVRLHTIDNSEFNHGATRNLGVEMTSGEFVAFLTQDALPRDNKWLFNLVSSIEHYPEAAGAFGRHVAHADASEFVKRDIENHFLKFDKFPLALSRDTDSQRYSLSAEKWCQLLHFYSDNNSCLRREVWKSYPYPVANFGEDQLWAKKVIDAGHQKVYARWAVVSHSHSYDEKERFERAKTEADFFRREFGYDIPGPGADFMTALKDANLADERWASDHHVSAQETNWRKKLNAARLRGIFFGHNTAVFPNL